MLEFLKQNNGLITLFLSIIISLATTIYVYVTWLMVREMSRQRKDLLKATYENQILALTSLKVNLIIINVEKQIIEIETEINRLDTAIDELKKKLTALT